MCERLREKKKEKEEEKGKKENIKREKSEKIKFGHTRDSQGFTPFAHGKCVVALQSREVFSAGRPGWLKRVVYFGVAP